MVENSNPELSRYIEEAIRLSMDKMNNISQHTELTRALFGELHHIEINMYTTIKVCIEKNDPTIVYRVMPMLIDMLNNTSYKLIQMLYELYFKLDPTVYVKELSMVISYISNIADTMTYILYTHEELKEVYSIRLNDKNVVIYTKK